MMTCAGCRHTYDPERGQVRVDVIGKWAARCCSERCAVRLLMAMVAVR